jgi:putative membrane protein
VSVHDLPLINATLNGIAGVLLIIGYIFIRRRKVSAHYRVMWSAFIVSCIFLVCYLVYHFSVGVIRFDKPGWIRDVYLWILGTHTVLACIVPVLAVITLSRGVRKRFAKHRAIARWTLPIWLYVSVTGVVVYVLLYQVCPRLPGPHPENRLAMQVRPHARFH